MAPGDDFVHGTQFLSDAPPGAFGTPNFTELGLLLALQACGDCLVVKSVGWGENPNGEKCEVHIARVHLCERHQPSPFRFTFA